MDEQRKRVYSFRQSLLEGAPPKDMVLEMIDNQIEDAADRFLADDYGAASFAEWVGQRLGVELTARDLKGASFEDAEEIASTKAERQLRETIRQAMDENLPADADPVRMDLAGPGPTGPTTASSSTSRKKTSRSSPGPTATSSSSAATDLEEFLNEKAVASLQKVDLVAGPRIPPARLGPPLARRLGASQVRHRRRPGRLGRARPCRDRPPDQGRGTARSTPSRKPSCPRGSP